MEDLHDSVPPDPEHRFRAAHADAYPDVLRFVTRRVHPSQAEDVVAEVFLVVWRRLRDMPPARSAARAWIFGIARRVILNTTRGDRLRAALEIRLADPTVLSPRVGLTLRSWRVASTSLGPGRGLRHLPKKRSLWRTGNT